MVVGTATASESKGTSGPGLTVPEAALDGALRCHDAPNPNEDREPALLVHGTTQTGAEAWDWNWSFVPALNAEGVDVCTVDLPDRADIQTSAEYTAYAIRVMSERYDSQVDVMEFSQGPLEPRWAVKFWPDVRGSVDEQVGLEPPNQGAAIGKILCAPRRLRPGSVAVLHRLELRHDPERRRRHRATSTTATSTPQPMTWCSRSSPSPSRCPARAAARPTSSPEHLPRADRRSRPGNG